MPPVGTIYLREEARADFSLDAKFIAYLSVAYPSETFFYGALQLDLTLIFRVRVWVSFEIFRHEIRLEACFSLSLTISIAVELVAAARSPALGGRLTASICVGAFGRSLRLGVGLSFNNDLIADTRARVARFMQLGLTAQHPDLEAGVPPPPPAPSRKQTLHEGDTQVETDAQTKTDLSTPESSATPSGPNIGRPIGVTNFWAMLFPAAGSRGSYVMQLVPRDHSPTGLGPTFDLTPNDASFFAPPDPSWADSMPSAPARTSGDYQIELTVSLPGGAEIHRLTADGSVSASHGIHSKLCFVECVRRQQRSGLTATVAICRKLLPRPRCEHSSPLHRTEGIPLESELLPQAADDAAKLLADASRQRDLLTRRKAREAEIAERCSAAIATVCESAIRLAGGGSTSPAAQPGIDARHFGLTFLINDAALDALFPAWRQAATDKPPGVTEGRPDRSEGTVFLYNPPLRFFARSRNQEGPRRLRRCS